MLIRIARLFAELKGYDVVRIPATATGPGGRKVVAIQFSDGSGVAGEVLEDFMGKHLEQAAEICGEGSLPANALKLTRGQPL